MPTLPSAALADCRSASPCAFGEMVRRGLARTPRQLEPLYFYDALGSALFDAITRLPEYTITRAELALLERHGGEIASALGSTPDLIELGPGNGEKLEQLMKSGAPRSHVHLIDISPAALVSAATRLREHDGAEVTCFAGTFSEGLRALPQHGRARLVLFLGSNLGNLTPPQAGAFLREVRAALAPGDGLLLGLDLVKPEPALLAAYDDPLGVTAAFNKNLLARMNRELGANFDLLGWDHRAVWNARHGRVEMHLVSVIEQTVAISALGLTVAFRAGETIWTESSHKYDEAGVRALVEAAGFRVEACWRNCEHRFLEALCVA